MILGYARFIRNPQAYSVSGLDSETAVGLANDGRNGKVLSLPREGR
jgi:hypothetical protein